MPVMLETTIPRKTHSGNSGGELEGSSSDGKTE